LNCTFHLEEGEVENIVLKLAQFPFCQHQRRQSVIEAKGINPTTACNRSNQKRICYNFAKNFSVANHHERQRH